MINMTRQRLHSSKVRRPCLCVRTHACMKILLSKPVGGVGGVLLLLFFKNFGSLPPLLPCLPTPNLITKLIYITDPYFFCWDDECTNSMEDISTNRSSSNKMIPWTGSTSSTLPPSTTAAPSSSSSSAKVTSPRV